MSYPGLALSIAWSAPPLPVWAACCHSGGCSDQPGQLDEIVGSHCQRELEVELLNTTQHWPRQSADGLAPPEWLLNPLALLLADLVPTMADSATIDGGEAIGGLPSLGCRSEVLLQSADVENFDRAVKAFEA
jgi:hypothetical protein